jgi:hypothetical protein
MCREPLAADGYHQHHLPRLWVVHCSGIEAGFLGSNQPLHGGQGKGHGKQLMSPFPERKFASR